MKKLVTLFIAASAIATPARSQTSTLKKVTPNKTDTSKTSGLADKREDKSDIFTYVEQMPEPTVNISEYLAENIVYPKDAQDMNISGRVVLKFVVNDRGYVEQVKVVNSVYPSIDSTAVAVLKKMPRWTPGHSKGKPVKVYYTLPIRFQLDNSEKESKASPGYDLQSWIKANLKYPQVAIDNKVQSSVIVGFTVKEDGSIVNAAISIGVNPLLDKEALRLVRIMPKWKPALKGGKPVSSYFALPVAFTLKK